MQEPFDLRSLRPRTWAGIVSVLSALTLVLVACEASQPPQQTVTSRILPDTNEVDYGLIPFTGTCAYTGSTVTVTVNSGDIAVISQNAGNGNAILVNGTVCGNANVANTKTISLAESGSAGPETVVLDYLYGLFALGSSTAGNGVTSNFGTDANDKLQIRMPNQNSNVVMGVSGVNLNADNYKDVLFSTIPSYVTVSLGSSTDAFSAGGDSVTGAVFTSPVIVYGGDGNDTLRGGNGNDFLYGEGGDDFLNAESTAVSADTFDGGDGNDTLSYALRANDLTITLGDPNAHNGEVGEGDVIFDTIEILQAGNGNDTLSGSPNALFHKQIFGNAGNDNFKQLNASGADSHDILSGGTGTDTVDYTVRTVGVNVSLDGNPNDGSSGENDNVMGDIENIRTGDGADVIVGNANDNAIFAGNGVNNVSGGAGNDTFTQGGDANNTGFDTISGGTGTDTVDYSLRTAALTVVMDGTTNSGDPTASEADKIQGDVENVTTGSGADTITGNANNNFIIAGAGNDNVTAGAGDDTIDAGNGNDTVDCGLGNDIVIDGEHNNVDCEIQAP